MVEFVNANQSESRKATEGGVLVLGLRESYEIWSERQPFLGQRSIDCTQLIENATKLAPFTRRERKPSGTLFCAVICTTLILAACIPVPRLDSEITDEQLLPIETGNSTRAEVEAILGKPTIIWESEHVWVYEEGPSGAFLWIIPGGYSIAIFLTELGEDVVIMRFDEDGKVERMDRRVGPLFRHNYGSFLRAWLAEDSDEHHSNGGLLKTGMGK